MGAKLNLLNQSFGKLTVIRETKLRKHNSVVWECQCECGNIRLCSTKELRSDGIKSCRDCNESWKPSKVLEDIVGKKFNHWTVIEATDKRQSGKILYKCICDCASKTIAYRTRTELQSEKSKDCGCQIRKYQIGDTINSFTIVDISNNRIKPYIAKCNFCGKLIEINNQRLENNLSCGCQHISKGEFEIEKILLDNNIIFKREFCFPNTKYRYDFAIYKDNQLIRLIEFDGELHYKDQIKNQGWNTLEHFEETQKRDKEKNLLAKQNRIPLIRIPYWERGNIKMSTLFSNEYLVKE